ncbi:purine nucleoside permease [Flagelloscypha sp. PMI_526]|nr:purine nucleoside permease [Flagelloscypha sp. PMI_526]
MFPFWPMVNSAWLFAILGNLLHTLGFQSLPIQPRVFILSMFEREASQWLDNPNLPSFYAHNLSIPGLSPVFPTIHCTEPSSKGTVCQATLGEGTINSALSLSAIVNSPQFDLRETYFLIAGVAGITPKVGTIGSVTFPRFAVQVSLNYELDSRDVPSELGWQTGFVPQGSTRPDEFPKTVYGTEVFELNDALRKLALDALVGTKLNDTQDAIMQRSRYQGGSGIFAVGAEPPSVLACDTATSDTFWSGGWLSDTFENTTRLFTRGEGYYCSSQQEDNALLEVFARAPQIDFSRILILRSGSNFDRPPEGGDAVDNLLYRRHGFVPALENVGIAGEVILRMILNGWEDVFKRGVLPTNHVGRVNMR